jgi:hypothetical protein
VIVTEERPKTDRMPPRKGYVRKLISVSPETAARVREYRFRHRLLDDTQAYRELLEKALDADEKEVRAKPKEQKP